MRKIIPFGILTALLTLLVALPAQAGGPPDGPPGLARAIAAQEGHTEALLAKAGVVGTGVGLTAGGKPAVVIFTESAGVAGLPRSLDGIPVRVKVTGKVFAAHHQPGHCGGPPGSWDPATCNGGGGNTAPAADDKSVNTLVDTNVTITLTGSDADGCGATFAFTITQSPTGGSLGGIGAVSCDGGSLDADVTYDPDPTTTDDSFTFTIGDGTETSNPATVSITISDGSVPPANIGTSSGTELLYQTSGGIFCSGGTLGARLVDDKGTPTTADDDYYALSNAHVYAQEGSDTVEIVGGVVVPKPASTSDRILQPGRIDLSPGCGTADEINDAVIGTLANWVAISFSSDNTVDAAIAATTTSDVGTATPAGGYGEPKSTTLSAAAALGQNVQKYGRTSSYTTGTITVINVTVNVGYDNGVATFVDQIFIEGDKGSFLKSGDSGSLLVINGGGDDRKPVGLLFASSKMGNGKFAWANEIGNVLTAFGVAIDGE